MTDNVDSLYEQAEQANREVAATSEAYAKATRRRGRIFLALRRSGESFHAMGKRLGVSSTRVLQIVTNAEKAEKTEES